MAAPLSDKLTRVLIPFIDNLKLGAELWYAAETPSEVTVESKVSIASATSLKLSDFTELQETYGSAVHWSFRRGLNIYLQNANRLDQKLLDAFRTRIATIPPDDVEGLTFYLQINKQILLQNWFPGVPAIYHLTLFLFDPALRSFLQNSITNLEAWLWPTSDMQKSVILTLGRDVQLNGCYLAVVGREQFLDWQRTITSPLPDIERAKQIYEDCRDHIIWNTSTVPVQRITPLHLAVSGTDASRSQIQKDQVRKALAIHLATLTLLYTATQTSEKADTWVCIYAGAQQDCPITIPHITEDLIKDIPSNDEDLLKVVDWTYSPEISLQPRLPVVKSVVVQLLGPTDPDKRFIAFITSAKAIAEMCEWQWGNLLEDRVKSYLSDLKPLQDAVSSTVTAITQQIADLVKGLSDSMLAAVATIIGTVIAAFFQEKYRPLVFITGLVLYGAYVLIFPMLLGLNAKWHNYRILLRDYKARRNAIASIISEVKVKEVEGIRIQNGKVAFITWLIVACLIYLFLAGGAFYFARDAMMPNGIISTIVTSVAAATPTTTVSASPTPILTPIEIPTR